MTEKEAMSLRPGDWAMLDLGGEGCPLVVAQRVGAAPKKTTVRGTEGILLLADPSGEDPCGTFVPMADLPRLSRPTRELAARWAEGREGALSERTLAELLSQCPEEG